MTPLNEACLSLLLLAVLALLLYVRARYPRVSKGAETAMLAGATILFFAICNVYLGFHKPPAPAARQVQQSFRR
ncbi:MAG TPA: hypothetical protein VMT86_14095 [Bryobacteraceae bacterium]|nr:hypothetical protein [Bryobacteraceae bacterium]